MKFILVLAIIIIAYPIFTLGRIKFVTSQAKLPTFSQNQQTLGEGPSLTYVAAGDSTAVGLGASKAEHTYTFLVAEYLANKFSVNYLNTAVTGARSSDFISQQLPKIIAANPDIITISIGANDIARLKNTGEVLDNYRSIISTLTQETQADIYITNIPRVDKATLLPYLYRQYIGSEIKWLNPRIQELQTERVRIIDIYNFGWDKYPNPDTTFAKDRFHPSDEGYRNWANAFLTEITKTY